MDENQNVEERPDDGKSASPSAAEGLPQARREDIHDDGTVNIETVIPGEDPSTKEMEVHHHPQPKHE